MRRKLVICGFAQYLAKYSLVNPKEKRWWPKSFHGFHQWSAEAYVSKDFHELKELYKKHVQFSDPEGIEKLVRAGIMEQNKSMSKLVERLISNAPYLKKVA